MGKRFKVLHNDYRLIQKEIVKKDQVFLRVTQKAGCYLCERNDYDVKIPFENRFANCKGCPFSAIVLPAFQAKVELYKKLEITEKKYAKVVFDFFKEQKPDLIQIRDSKVIKWEEAFPDEFNSINSMLYGSLVGLIEKDGGRYRLS